MPIISDGPSKSVQLPFWLPFFDHFGTTGHTLVSCYGASGTRTCLIGGHINRKIVQLCCTGLEEAQQLEISMQPSDSGVDKTQRACPYLPQI